MRLECDLNWGNAPWGEKETGVDGAFYPREIKTTNLRTTNYFCK